MKGSVSPLQGSVVGPRRVPRRCPGLVCFGPFGAGGWYFGDRLITMNQNPLAGSFKFGARENRMNRLRFLALLVTLVASTGALLLAAAGCGTRPTNEEGPVQPLQRLSQYALFVGDAAAQEPAPGVIPYDLNSALFSDYADKLRFINLPAGTHATYRDDDVFDFPVGTVIAKTFAFPHDARAPSQGRRLIETRILNREPESLVGLPQYRSS